MNTPKICPLFAAAQMTPTAEGDETQAHQYTTHENAAKWAGCLGSRCGAKWTTDPKDEWDQVGQDDGTWLWQKMPGTMPEGWGRCADGGDPYPDPAAEGGGQ